MSLSEQLGLAMAGAGPARIDPAAQADGLIVKVARLRHDTYPGRDAQGVLPVFVVGHEAMDETSWSDWVREHGIAHYGAGFTEKVIRDGIELKEMLPTAGFGRHMRKGTRIRRSTLEQASNLITAVEKWPQLYNTIATELGEDEMTLRGFLDKIHNLPSPWDVGRGTYTTLGDIIGPPGHMVLGNF
jgi:hypothetical protein